MKPHIFFYYLLTEKDNYEPCAGDAMRKCVMSTQTRWEQKGIKNWFIMVKTYVDCFEEEVKTCGAAILRHFVANFEAFLKHLWKDGNGKFGKMVDEIPPPPLP